MKKILLTATLAIIALASQAQVTVEGSKFTDNWSAGFKGGMVTPMRNHAFFGCARGAFGVNLQKQVIPSIGIGLEGEWSFNTSSWYDNAKSWNAIDHQYVGVYAAINLMNAFGGYTGAPRFFETELVAGTGWIHSYSQSQIGDGNSWGNKLGLNFNFNLGESKAWTLGIKPAILWNMGAKDVYVAGNLNSVSSRYNINAAAFELFAGITYHFKNSNGTHSFVLAKLYDQTLIDVLNDQVNTLRNDIASCNASNAALENQISNLQAELDACNRRPPVVEKIGEDLNNVRYIFFQLSSSYIQANQKPNLELISKAFANNPGATISVKGYASPEGSKSFNERLSTRRAEAVKKALSKQYNINPDIISAEGMGIGDMFSVPSWNRVAIITVQLK